MAISNLERVGRGLDALKNGLTPYILRQLKARYKERWWSEGIEPSLRGTVGMEAKHGKQETNKDRFAALDVQ